MGGKLGPDDVSPCEVSRDVDPPSSVEALTVALDSSLALLADDSSAVELSGVELSAVAESAVAAAFDV
jgi:hypothetical protein